MKIDGYISDDAVLDEVGARLKRARLARNITQEALATEAGVGARTIARIEDGEPMTVVNLVRVLRALGLLDNLDALVPQHSINPFVEKARSGRIRRRASASDASRPGPSGGKWVWGDQAGEQQ